MISEGDGGLKSGTKKLLKVTFRERNIFEKRKFTKIVYPIYWIGVSCNLRNQHKAEQSASNIRRTA